MAFFKEVNDLNTTTHQVFVHEKNILSKCYYSSAIWFRAKGLLGRKTLSEDEGLWLKPCNAIHMFFMKFPIDALFLDKQNKIAKIFHNLRPWQITPICWKTHSILEISSGFAKKHHLQIGDELKFVKN